jgi:hypothetical protein
MEKHEPEKSFVSLDDCGDKHLNLDVLLRTLIQRCMGKALDYARISGMTDRSLSQFERSVKDDFYKVIQDGVSILEEFNYLKPQNNDNK